MIIGVARDIGGFVTRVEIDITDLSNGIVPQRWTVASDEFQRRRVMEPIWDTSDLIHDRVYAVTVRAYDGDDYSQDMVWRMTINNPLDAENIDPVFNETGWVGTWTIFCDKNSNSFDRCGGGVSFDLSEFFDDPDGTGVASNDLEFYVYNDPQHSATTTTTTFVTVSRLAS